MSLQFKLTDEAKELMIDAAARAHPAEACGIIAGSLFYELPNQATGTSHFRILAEDVARVATHHGGFEAVWHSHPSGRTEPSASDRAGHPLGKALIIVAGDQVVVHEG